MERFVFIAAITVAIIYGLAVMIDGPDHVGFHFDSGSASPVVETAPGRLEAQTYAARSILIEGAAARLTVIPEDREDISVEIDNTPGRAPMPQVSVQDGLLRIDGQLRRRVEDCVAGGGVSLRGYGDFSAEELPAITIRAPRALSLDLAGGGIAQIGPTQSLELDLKGCGEAEIADVEGELDVDLAGSGTVRAGAARHLEADVAGSGRLTAGVIADGADIDIAGSGDVIIASLTGALNTDGAGAGTIVVESGALTRLNVDLAGSGDIRITAPVERINADIMGSGSVRVDGVVGDIDADIAGSGTLRVQSVTGSVRQQTLGSGEVRIGE